MTKHHSAMFRLLAARTMKDLPLSFEKTMNKNDAFSYKKVESTSASLYYAPGELPQLRTLNSVAFRLVVRRTSSLVHETEHYVAPLLFLTSKKFRALRPSFTIT